MGAAQRPQENIKPTPYCSTLWDQKEEEETENHYAKRVSHQKNLNQQSAATQHCTGMLG